MSELEKAAKRAKDSVKDDAKVQSDPKASKMLKGAWQTGTDQNEKDAAAEFDSALEKKGLHVWGKG